MKKLCAILSGGADDTLQGIEQADFIIACDKGYAYAKAAGIRPDLLVGDFDSYDGPIPTDVPRLDLPVEKDDADTMAAVRWAVNEGFSALRLYCALGGRLDHLMGNIQAASFAVSHGLRAEILGENIKMYLFSGGSITLPPHSGFSISVLSLSDRCEGVSITGAKYPLQNVTVTNTFPVGISNEWEGDITISAARGILLVISAKK